MSRRERLPCVGMTLGMDSVTEDKEKGGAEARPSTCTCCRVAFRELRAWRRPLCRFPCCRRPRSPCAASSAAFLATSAALRRIGRARCRPRPLGGASTASRFPSLPVSAASRRCRRGRRASGAAVNATGGAVDATGVFAQARPGCRGRRRRGRHRFLLAFGLAFTIGLAGFSPSTVWAAPSCSPYPRCRASRPP